MSEQMRSYGVARTLFSILEIVGWLVVVVGIIAGFTLAGSAGRYVPDSQKVLLFLMGASSSLVGLFFVGAVQHWRAGVDSAEYNQQMLKVARDQLAVSKQGLKQNNSSPHGYAAKTEESPIANRRSFSAEKREASRAPKVQPEPQTSAGQKIEHSGKTILVEGDTYSYDGIPFKSLEKAQHYIDTYASKSLPEPFRVPE
ncbi:hypothetical protein [Aliiroseovarius sp.]|uniref:hypothetical protein n=1 Tax=Aliiroseovarius sp. TaxID=1872442 RepID=UPI003BA95EA1